MTSQIVLREEHGQQIFANPADIFLLKVNNNSQHKETLALEHGMKYA